MHVKGLPREPALLLGKRFGGRVLSNVILRTHGLEENSNDIDELVEEHSQELTTEELTDLQRDLQQEVMEERLTEKEEKVTANQQSSAQ
ncbi:hypothetical protein AVEN_161784-1 [Araneus ventricosus]|uniref:Uncharacterized protein n=1 Tax=Araneus ventricosus TaxID=182803 RepID=A0A4Y2RAI7_ARAVE|nr:hypothetical protein AVEN_180674-1 [Araneus ventricosus]GBN72759.1 hypothetical protein AVEN_260876-1 [Araneus ventricosus]GBN72802.1 hypothetical protein AVEN_169418-1 [Araneus ventricosus]GBN72805.1 hypothetical protein AVEN_161784-1 [Araneus ventricosus]